MILEQNLTLTYQVPDGTIKLDGDPPIYLSPEGTIFRINPANGHMSTPKLHIGKGGHAYFKNYPGKKPCHIRVAPLAIKTLVGPRRVNQILHYVDGNPLNLAHANLQWITIKDPPHDVLSF